MSLRGLLLARTCRGVLGFQLKHVIPLCSCYLMHAYVFHPHHTSLKTNKYVLASVEKTTSRCAHWINALVLASVCASLSASLFCSVLVSSFSLPPPSWPPSLVHVCLGFSCHFSPEPSPQSSGTSRSDNLLLTHDQHPPARRAAFPVLRGSQGGETCTR